MNQKFLHTERSFTDEKMVVDPHDPLFKRLYDPTANGSETNETSFKGNTKEGLVF